MAVAVVIAQTANNKTQKLFMMFEQCNDQLNYESIAHAWILLYLIRTKSATTSQACYSHVLLARKNPLYKIHMISVFLRQMNVFFF